MWRRFIEKMQSRWYGMGQLCLCESQAGGGQDEKPLMIKAVAL
jgi:hypothetical protein